MITTYANFLNERKQVGILYHFTTIQKLEKILKENSLKSYYNYVSFTRNKFMETGGVRIVIDGDKLSDKYKIEPYYYGEVSRYTNGIPHLKREAEERVVLSTKPEDIKNDGKIGERGFITELKDIVKYIIGVDVLFADNTYYNYDWMDEPIYNKDSELIKKVKELKIEFPKIEWKSTSPFIVNQLKKKYNKNESIINERKQVGILYHFTTIQKLEKILKENSLKSYYNYVSFTRNKFMNNYGVRIVIDGDKLSDKYKIESFIYDEYGTNKHGIPSLKIEAEERIVLSTKPEDIKNDGNVSNGFKTELKGIIKYIIGIDIFHHDRYGYYDWIDKKILDEFDNDSIKTVKKLKMEFPQIEWKTMSPYVVPQLKKYRRKFTNESVKKSKDRKVLFVDEHGKNIVYEYGDYRIVVNNPNDAEYITLWYKENENKWKKCGYLETSTINNNGKKFLKINNIHIDIPHRGKGYGNKLYQALIDFSADDICGLYSYLPNRSNKKQVPAIYKKYNAETIDGDHQYIHFINERKQVGIIYHFTSFKNLINILRENSLKAYYPYISFTRNRLFRDSNVRIVFDGDKLSDKYKIEPYLYDGKFAPKNKHGIPILKSEAEERIVLVNRDEELPASFDFICELENVKKYIIRIDYIDDRDLKYNMKEIEKEFPEIEFRNVKSMNMK